MEEGGGGGGGIPNPWLNGEEEVEIFSYKVFNLHATNGVASDGHGKRGEDIMEKQRI